VFSRSFTIDYQKNTFLKDGKPFRYISGTLHYFQVPSEFWHDRLYKMKMAGINTVQTYVEWSHHEPELNVYNFDGDYNLPKFLKTAQDLGMLVVFRAGPYIDAERDMGGLPYWLLREHSDMNLRTIDPKFIKYVDKWYSVLFPLIEPFLYNNGGPIITLQIENEYGSYGCDAEYKSYLREYAKKALKNNVVLFTTDGATSNALTCGKVDEVLSTIDFGSGVNVTHNFEMLRWNQASGPLVNSEFYPGWMDHWGQPHSTASIDAVVKTLTEMLKANASVNIYPFHGGTNFGFAVGSNLGSTFQPIITSYDFDAPLNEAGDPTSKYYAIRKAIGKFFPLPPGPVPQPSPKMQLPAIVMKKVMSLWDFTSMSDYSVFSPYPLSFEDLSHPYGFVLYKTTVSFRTPDPVVLTVKGIADRAHVYVNKVLQGVLSREQRVESIPVQVLKGQDIEILVENQGRVAFGAIHDRKGIIQNVTLGSKTLVNWTMIPVPLDFDSVQKINVWKSKNLTADSTSVPAIYSGEFNIPNDSQIFDSFLKVDGWHKGVAFLNNFNLGKYWPIVGPQLTLYAPSTLFRKSSASNHITLLELQNAPCGGSGTCTVQFVDSPILNGPTPE
ncbi:Beta-galactosidase, partial [Araneus ventricosus]